MIFVVNDLHGQPALVNKTVNAIYKMSVGDTLIVNGDGAGSRGPKMNRLVKIFYEVRRGETGKEKLIQILTEIIGFKPDIPDTWIFDSAHVALFRAIVSKNFDAFKKCVEEEIVAVLEETIIPISKAARERGVRLLYSPGNGEIVPSDFSTEDITVEKTLRPEERFYQRLADQGYFEKYAIEYIPRAAVNLENRVGVISSNLLDLNWEECRTLLQKVGF